MGRITESSKEKGPTHPEDFKVPTMVQILPLTRISFPTGLLPAPNTSSTITFPITTTLSHLFASDSLKNLPWSTERGMALGNCSFQARTLYCFLVSQYTSEALQKNISVPVVTYFAFWRMYLMSRSESLDLDVAVVMGCATMVVTLRKRNWSSIALETVFPIATTKMMVMTPITIPSIDRLERSRFDLRDLSESLMMSMRRFMGNGKGVKEVKAEDRSLLREYQFVFLFS